MWTSVTKSILLLSQLATGEGLHEGSEVRVRSLASESPQKESCWQPPKEAECSNPGKFITEVLDTLKKHNSLEAAIKELASKASAVGAIESSSLQSSTGTDDPRIHLYTPCTTITFTIFGDSVEMAVTHQKAEKGNGEILVHLPAGGRGKPTEYLNTPGSNRCTSCHMANRTSSYGTTNIVIEGRSFETIISPYVNAPQSAVHHAEDLYCIPNDLRRLDLCLCRGNSSWMCNEWFGPYQNSAQRSGPQRKTACGILDAVVNSGLKPNCMTQPTRSLASSDPHAHGGKCRTDRH